jgi:hypothetical protein
VPVRFVTNPISDARGDCFEGAIQARNVDFDLERCARNQVEFRTTFWTYRSMRIDGSLLAIGQVPVRIPGNPSEYLLRATPASHGSGHAVFPSERETSAGSARSRADATRFVAK